VPEEFWVAVAGGFVDIADGTPGSRAAVMKARRRVWERRSQSRRDRLLSQQRFHAEK
jgi:hypothetical protein